MEEKEFKFDVAFSFVGVDESIAEQINHLLEGRLNTFLYSEKHKETAGADGEEMFHSVFGKESRIVVVLFRETWGKTQWTKVEQTAIRNRALKGGGYGFVFVVKVEAGSEIPEWFPQTNLWFDLPRYGVEGAAAAIEHRAQQAGGIPREETVADLAKKLNREKQIAEERKGFLESAQGAQAAIQEMGTLFSFVEEKVQEISDAAFQISAKRSRDGWGIDVGVSLASLGITWFPGASNNVVDGYLEITLWRGWHRRLAPGRFDQPERKSEKKFGFDRDPAGRFFWQSRGVHDRFSSKRLVEENLKSLMKLSRTLDKK